MAFMIVETGDLNGRKIDLIGSLVVGRQVREGMTIKDAKASRENTRFELTSGGWVVIDLESTNGTLLNGRKITREFLNSGDRVTVGQTVFRFENSAAQPMTTTADMAARKAGSRPVGAGTGALRDPGPPPPAPAPPPPAAARPPAAAPPPPAGPPPAAPAARTGPSLRYQDVNSGPGIFTWLLCAAILVGIVFAAKWLGGRALAKAMEDQKALQQGGK